jgi:AcrR family transcriptional regulator
MGRSPDFSPRRQPQQARSRETVDTIFEAMLDVLSKRNLDDPTVQTIADRAGVSVGSVYQYFPSKGALVSGLLRYHLKLRMDEVDAALAEARGLSGRAAAEKLVEGLVSGARGKSKVELAMIRYFARAGDLAALTEQDERMYASVRSFLEALGGDIRTVNLDIAAFLISNALRTAVLLSLVQRPERLEDPAFTQELTCLIESYLRAPAA